MRIYWVRAGIWGRRYFKLTYWQALHDVLWRYHYSDDQTDFSVETDDVPDELFGTCWNTGLPILPYQPDCSVGMIRKLRACASGSRGISVKEGVPGDDGRCGTCPYFIRKNLPSAGLDGAVPRFPSRNGGEK